MNNMRRLFTLSRKLPWQYVCQSQTLQTRHLLTPSSLGLDSFVAVADRTKESISDKEDFKRKVKKLVEPDSSSLILLNDVTTMIAVSETDEDLEVLHELLIKYFKEQESFSFKIFKISPVVMRALHILNKPKQAMQIVEDPVCNPHFHVFNAILVFLDLLLNNHMYDEVLKFYNQFESYFNPNPRHLSLLLLAACYKLNSEESYAKAKSVFRLETENRLSYRKIVLMAAIAINHNEAFCALEVLNSLKKFDSLPANLKFMALIKGGRHSDALNLANNLLQRAHLNRLYIVADVMSCLEKDLINVPEEYKNSFEELLKKFETHATPKTLDDFLLAQVQLALPKVNQNEKQRQLTRRAVASPSV